MLTCIKQHFSKSYNVVFWIFFGPAMFMTLAGVLELYTTYFDELTTQDHFQFLMRFLFPVALATFVTALDRRHRLQREAIVEQGKAYLKRKRSTR